jgi:glyoxylase-like metal-dependent hydrolase (beta-lactamase superfamily II)
MTPPSARLVNGQGGFLERARLVCHVLLVELQDGLMLVDTGFGLNDIAHRGAFPAAFLRLVAPRLDAAETAVEQIRAVGYTPDDVHHIVMTHLDRDHAGGLADFPSALVHVHRSEYRAAVTGEIAVRAGRYGSYQWQHGPRWKLHDRFDDDWLGLPSARIDVGRDTDVRLVPLTGHTPGHSGVAIKTEGGWMLHAGDSYYHRNKVITPPRLAPIALELLKRTAESDREKRLASERKVRELRQRAGLTIFCTHDPVEFDQLSAANPVHNPAPAPSTAG